MRFWLLIAIMIAGLVAALLAGDEGLIAGLESGRLIQATVLVTMIGFVGWSVLGDYRGRINQAVRDMAVWLGLAVVLIAGYSFRDEFQNLAHRITGELLPPGQTQSVASDVAGERAVRIRRRPDGHFIARGEVDGATLVLMVDTGASTVVLKPTDARAAGINIDTLSYSVPVRTANGTAYAAAVRLKRLSIGGITVEGVEALVAKPGALNENLLGMSFLRRLRSYEFSGDFLTLRG